MKNIYSNIFKLNKKNILKATHYLNSNDIVALPTETVYGLAGNAYSNKSIKKIYSLKKRPKFNPLIIHYYELKNIYKDVEVNDSFLRLYKKYCPGPITFVLKRKKNSKISKLATAERGTIAIRFPDHLKIRKILKKLNFPLAIPSANKSSDASPVDVLDVFEEFKKKVKLIVDGGQSEIGIESTVIDLTSKPKILRPGIIGSSKIEKILKLKIKDNVKNIKIKSPGMQKKHYSPGIPMTINQLKSDNKSAYIYLGRRFKNKKNYFSLSENSNLNEAAANLYKTFRLIKKLGFKKIQIAKIPFKGSGVAINDRIKRAASQR